mmetsp:Transcript_13127/g.24941  ORF Transcript_13127/g.24941 Transcript_13127/m.24941 type:complete len:220 (-) Transcript_13127:468-1127(-)
MLSLSLSLVLCARVYVCGSFFFLLGHESSFGIPLLSFLYVTNERLDLLAFNDRVHDPILESIFRLHVERPHDVLVELFLAVARVPGENAEHISLLGLDFPGLDCELDCLPRPSGRHSWLVKHSGRVRKHGPLSFRTRCKQHARLAYGNTHVDGRNVTSDVIHSVIDGSRFGLETDHRPVRSARASAVYVHVNVFPWLFILQVEELRNYKFAHSTHDGHA